MSPLPVVEAHKKLIGTITRKSVIDAAEGILARGRVPEKVGGRAKA